MLFSLDYLRPCNQLSTTIFGVVLLLRTTRGCVHDPMSK
jgi:hypothetical protein